MIFKRTTSTTSPETEHKPGRGPIKLLRLFISKFISKPVMILVVLASLGFGGWAFYQYQHSQQQIAKLSSLEGQQELQKTEVESLKKSLSKHMLLPSDEEPSIATITNIEVLKKDQPFFEKAQNGDKVVVYSNEKKAIIYSPQKDVVVNVGALVVDQSASAPTQAEILSLEIRNGTTETGLARKISDMLKNKNQAFSAIDFKDAAKQDYKQTVVVDLGKNQNKQLIKSLSTVLGTAVVTTLPEGESGSKADVLVIIGQDQNQR